MVAGPKSQQEAQVALKFPRRRVRNTETQNAQDMNDALLPVVEEMGRLNEHNFNQTIKGELTLNTDLTRDVAFKVVNDFVLLDASPMAPNLEPNKSTITKNQVWQEIHPDELTKDFTSVDGGMFRLIASGQFVTHPSSVSTVYPFPSYTRYAFKIDGAIMPDSIIGDQDYSQSHQYMEIGYAGLYGSFLLDFTIYLHPGKHRVAVVGWSSPSKGGDPDSIPYKTGGNTFPNNGDDDDIHIYSAEALYWEMSR